MDKTLQPTPLPAGAVRRAPRRWLPAAGAILLVLLLTAGFWPQPVPVETTLAVVGPLRSTVNEEGKTRIRQRFVISAPVTGHLRRIPFKAGAEVVAGRTILAVIDPITPTLLDARSRSLNEARRDVAKANLDKARDAHDYAASELRRYQKLSADKMVSVQDLEAAQWRETSAARESAAAESALRQAEAELVEFLPGDTQSATNSARPPVEVIAPVGGRVLHVFEESSRVVVMGTNLLEIGDPADLEVVIDVLSRDGAATAPGARVEFEQWGGSKPLEGRVRLVEPAAFTKISALGVEEQRVNVIADFLTPPAERAGVGDNFRVEARIIVWEAASALKVPTGALFRRGDQWTCFVVTGGRAVGRNVKIGRSSGTEIQVIEGLTEGEQVVIYPGSRVQNKQRVRPVKI